jgi:hypothetical protein
MKSKFLSKLFDTNELPPMTPSSNNYYFYKLQLNELDAKNIEQTSFSEFINTIKSSSDFTIYKDLLNNINTNLLYTSRKHGIQHNERVSLFAYYLCTKLKLNEIDTKISLYASMYHDIGRKNDFEDPLHGRQSANKLDELHLDLKGNELNILKSIITCHSLPDTDFNKIAEEYKINDYNRALQLFQILKDADGLDRARLNHPTIKINYLRNNISPSLIPIAYKLSNFYLETEKD